MNNPKVKAAMAELDDIVAEIHREQSRWDEANKLHAENVAGLCYKLGVLRGALYQLSRGESKQGEKS